MEVLITYHYYDHTTTLNFKLHKKKIFQISILFDLRHLASSPYMYNPFIFHQVGECKVNRRLGPDRKWET